MSTIPGIVIWAYLAFSLVIAIGLVAVFRRGEWQGARGLEKLIVLGPIFYAAPIAAFGTEHFTVGRGIASLIPKWIPWPLFWTWLLGACFIAAALSIVTGIQARLSGALLALTFFLFVLLMDAPAWAGHPENRFAATLALRQLSFSAGALALTASLASRSAARRALETIARVVIAVTLLFYSVMQFIHPDHVPGVPLDLRTPGYIFAGATWAYLAAVVYAIAGTLLLVGWKSRLAAGWTGLTILLLDLAVYVPIAVEKRASVQGINFLADTLMFAGAVLLLARCMPREVLAPSERGQR